MGIYHRPDYVAIANCFKKMLKRHNVTFATPYDWEIKEKATLGAVIVSEIKFFAKTLVGQKFTPFFTRGLVQKREETYDPL